MAGIGSAVAFGGWRHRASQFYFLIIVFAFPLFSLPCRKGTCSNPVEIVASSLLSNGAPEGIAKALLYPALMFSKVESVVADNEAFSFPNWNTMLTELNMSKKQMEEKKHPFNIGIEIGCYACVLGAVFAPFGQMVVSAGGMLLVLWYIYTLGAKQSDVYALPMFGLAVFCSVAGFLNLESFFKKEQTSKQPSQENAGKVKKQN